MSDFAREALKEDAVVRDRLAEPLLQRIDDDRRHAPEHVRPWLDELRRRLFDISFSISALWVACRVSRRDEASRELTLVTGLTPWQYVVELRMTVAAAMLLATGLAPWRIGRAVGFDQQKSFRRAFKRVYDMSPTEFRESRRPDALTDSGAQPIVGPEARPDA